MALTEDEAWSSSSALPPEGARDEPIVVRKEPTGNADLDSIVDGGFPSGSTVLLKGDIGAGMQEFAYTAASKIAIVNDRPS